MPVNDAFLSFDCAFCVSSGSEFCISSSITASSFSSATGSGCVSARSSSSIGLDIFSSKDALSICFSYGSFRSSTLMKTERLSDMVLPGICTTGISSFVSSAVILISFDTYGSCFSCGISLFSSCMRRSVLSLSTGVSSTLISPSF